MTPLAGKAAAPPRPALVLAVVCLGMFLVQLDATIVNVALPDIRTDLGASVSALQWVVDGYTVPLAALLLTAGRLGDLFGNKRLFLTGLTVFGLASVGCALAPDATWLNAARAVQGIGAALELPASLAILSHAYPGREERARAIGVWSAAAGLSLVIGPVLGGWLVDVAGWQSVFVLNVPVALCTGVLAVVLITETRQGADKPRAYRLDLPGQVLAAVFLLAITIVAIEGHRNGWLSVPNLALVLVAVVALIGFVRRERGLAEPLLPLGYFRDRSFTVGNIAGLVQGFLLFGLLFVFSLFFQGVRGDSATTTGLRFLPISVSFVLIGPVAGRVVGRIGNSRWILACGLALMGAGTALMARVDVGTDYLWIALPFVVIGIGFALATTALVAAVMGAVPAERMGMASGVSNTARQVGGVLGVAILGSLIATEQSATAVDDLVSGLRTALVIASCCAFAGAVIAAAVMRGSRPSKDPAGGDQTAAVPAGMADGR